MALKSSYKPWNKGKRLPPLSAEHRTKIGAAQIGRVGGMKGKQHSPEARKKISLSTRGDKAHSYKDGLESHYLASTFYNMMQRCYNPKRTKEYPNYGAKGVTVWVPWHNRSSFIFGVLSFLGDRPLNFTLDRINPHSSYTPYNIRWLDRRTQLLNIRENVADYLPQWGDH